MSDEKNKNLESLIDKTIIDLEEHRKIMLLREKKFKLFNKVLICFMLSVIIAGIISFTPLSINSYAKSYLLICNFLSAILCIWSIIRLAKSNLLKQKFGLWVSVACIIGFVINVFSLVNNFL